MSSLLTSSVLAQNFLRDSSSSFPHYILIKTFLFCQVLDYGSTNMHILQRLKQFLLNPVATSLGFEPRRMVSETTMLPLHREVILFHPAYATTVFTMTMNMTIKMRHNIFSFLIAQRTIHSFNFLDLRLFSLFNANFIQHGLSDNT